MYVTMLPCAGSGQYPDCGFTVSFLSLDGGGVRSPFLSLLLPEE